MKLSSVAGWMLSLLLATGVVGAAEVSGGATSSKRAAATSDWVAKTEARPTVEANRAAWAAAQAALALPEKPGTGPSGRIYNGTAAARGAYPWMVALVSRPVNTSVQGLYDEQFCGGSLIHPQWVLTAAHCVVENIPTEVAVAVGALNLQSDTAGQYQLVNVVDIIIHPDYQVGTFDHDVALLLLEAPVSGITPVELVRTEEETAPGTLATVIGWGDTQPSSASASNYPAELRQTQVPLVSTEVANQPASYGGQITDAMLAAGYDDGRTDSCPGDSGGPLVVPGPVAGTWRQAGIVSWGDGCGVANKYGVYSRITWVRAWILGQIYPNYTAFEESQGRAEPLADFEENGIPLLLEHSIGGMRPTLAGPTAGSLSYQRRADSADLTYVVEQAASPGGPWQVLPVTNVVQRTSTYWESVSASPVNPATALPFWRLAVGQSTTWGPRWPELGLGQGVTTFSHGLLNPGTGGTGYSRDFLYVAGADGLSVTAVARSIGGDASLLIINDVTGATVASDDSTGGGTDALVTFTTAANTIYRLRATEKNALPNLRLRVALPETAGLATLSSGQTINSTLTTTEEHPETPGFFKKDYRLTATPGTALRLTLRSSVFDAYLEIYDGETGQYLTYDDDSGRDTSTLDSMVDFVVPTRGHYLVRVTHATETPNSGAFTLSAASATVTALTLNASATSGTLNATTSPFVLRSDGEGRLVNAYFQEFTYLHSGSAASLTVDVNSANLTTLDPVVQIQDAITGLVLARNDDLSASNYNAQAAFPALPGGRYRIRCSTSFPQQVGNFTVRVRQ